MDSAEFLDLLGNANRRRILRLLAQRSCYVTEISDFLGVSPKAVIDHLQKLEDAGLVESRTDDRQRKYFSIARNIQLEVTVSPYEFGTKSAYPASSRLDITSCRRLNVQVDRTSRSGEHEGTLGELAGDLHELEQLDRELSLVKRWVQGQMAELRERLAEEAGEDSRLVVDVLLAVADGGATVEQIRDRVNAPAGVVEEVLNDLAADGVVVRDGRRWRLD
ncbi:ArsR/SmtB family transcription factor [Halovenus marina]|uniref:ArsR/SmtB family transcription factor n=1 Tax=Halovenus marina TaxID=3396621 RepID=UPI003F55179A